MASVGGSHEVASLDHSSPASALTFRTIVEQQQIISGLQEIVDNLKSHIATYERAETGVSDSTTTARVSALERENEALRGKVAALTRAQLVAERRHREQTTAMERLEASHAAMETQLAACEERDRQHTNEQAVVHMIEARCRAVDRECQRLREQVAAAESQRRQWRALVDLLADRAEPAMQARVAAMVENIAAAGAGADLPLQWLASGGGRSATYNDCSPTVPTSLTPEWSSPLRAH